jgi:hypothetical protein
MGGIADAQETRPIPFAHAIDRDGQELHVVPIGDLAHAIAQDRRDPRHLRAERIEPAALDLIEPALGDDEGALPIIAAVDHHEHVAGIEPSHAFLGIAGALRQPQPQHVHGRAEIVCLQPRLLAHGRMASVGADDQIGAHLERARGHARPRADDAPALLDQVGDLGLHTQAEIRIFARVLREEIEEIPLRHQCDEFAAGRQVRKIRDRDHLVADPAAQQSEFLMRPLEEILEQAQFVHDLEGRGMDRVAAEITEEVGVLLEHDHVDAGARQ